jgi:hypothetical protein
MPFALTFSPLPVPLFPFRLPGILAGCLLFAVCCLLFAPSAKMNRLLLKDCAPTARCGRVEHPQQIKNICWGPRTPAVPDNHLNAADYLHAAMAALNSSLT